MPTDEPSIYATEAARNFLAKRPVHLICYCANCVRALAHLIDAVIADSEYKV